MLRLLTWWSSGSPAPAWRSHVDGDGATVTENQAPVGPLVLFKDEEENEIRLKFRQFFAAILSSDVKCIRSKFLNAIINIIQMEGPSSDLKVMAPSGMPSLTTTRSHAERPKP